MTTRTTIAIAAAAVASCVQPAHSSVKEKQLGSVHFETSCSPAAQKLFDRGMLYQHSFWYSASKRTFEEVLKADPQCAVAYWGIALGLLYNPRAPPPPDNIPPRSPEGLLLTPGGCASTLNRLAEMIEHMTVLRREAHG